MKLFVNKKSKQPLCEVHTCPNVLPDDPTIVHLDEHAFKICDECSILMDVITQKFEEREIDE